MSQYQSTSCEHRRTKNAPKKATICQKEASLNNAKTAKVESDDEEVKTLTEEDKGAKIDRASTTENKQAPESRGSAGERHKAPALGRKKQTVYGPGRKRQYMTRREVTEAKIVSNILNWNTPARQPNLKGLHIHGKNPLQEPK